MTERANSKFFLQSSLMGRGHFIEINLRMRLSELSIQFFKEFFVFDRALIQSLSQASLSYGFVGGVVKLGDQQVVDLLLRVF